MHLSREGEGRFLGLRQKAVRSLGLSAERARPLGQQFPCGRRHRKLGVQLCAATRAVAAFLRRDETVRAAGTARVEPASGSSCRSFFDPWCMWDGDSIHALDFHVGHPMHMVVIVDGGRKSVSSSDAHARVAKSTHFSGRVDRRTDAHRTGSCRRSRASDWRSAYEICFEEFEDMHELFHTSDPPFRYRTADSDRIVQDCADLWAR